MEFEILLDREKVPTGKKTKLLLLVRVTGEEQQPADQALPVNLSLVIDRSGSMQGEKLQYVKLAARELAQRLRASDTISVVSYDDRIEVPFPPAPASQRERVLQAVDSLTARNMTNLSGGWFKGCELVEQNKADGQVNRVILLSDGLANRGICDLERLRTVARDKRALGITTTTMGVGMDFNEDLMRAMAVEGGGAYYFIDNPDQAPQIFQEELADLNAVVGQNLAITLEIAKTVRAVRQLNSYPASGQLAYQLGEIFGGETRTQVFELTVGPLPDGKTALGTVHMCCDALTAEGVDRVEQQLELQVSTAAASELENLAANEVVVRAALLQKAARAREKSVEVADARKFDEAARVLREAAEEIQASGINDELLQDEYRRLVEEAARLDFGERGFDAHSRKLHHSKSHHAERVEHYAMQSQALHERYMDAHAPLPRGGAVPTRVVMNGSEITLPAGRITVGSDPTCDFHLDHPTVKPLHCEMEILPDRWTILPSKEFFPVHANSGRVLKPFNISVGDAVTVGRVLLQFG